MKRLLKLTSLTVCLTMLLSLLPVFAGISVSAEVAAVTGAENSYSENIYLGGIDTGVRYTQMKLKKYSTYAPSSAGVLNVIEIESGSAARFQVINNGTYNWSTTTVGAAAVA